MHDNVLHDTSYTTYRVRHVSPSFKEGEDLDGRTASHTVTAQLAARWRLVDPDAAVLHRSGRGPGCLDDAVQSDRQPGEQSGQHSVRPYPGKHLHLFSASRGDEYDFRPDRRPYSYRTFSDALDMAAAPSDDVGFDPSGSRRLGDNSGGAEPGERQCAVPPDRGAEYPRRQCSDDLARTGHLGPALGIPDRASPC